MHSLFLESRDIAEFFQTSSDQYTLSCSVHTASLVHPNYGTKYISSLYLEVSSVLEYGTLDGRLLGSCHSIKVCLRSDRLHANFHGNQIHATIPCICFPDSLDLHILSLNKKGKSNPVVKITKGKTPELLPLFLLF